MSFDPVAALYDDVAELTADARMHRRRAPRTRIEYDHEAGTHTFLVLVDGQEVASASGASIERASRLCRETFAAWREDSPEGLVAALSLSLTEARAR